MVFADHQVPRETAVELPVGFDQDSYFVFFGNYNSLLSWRRGDCAPSSKVWVKMVLIVQGAAQNGDAKARGFQLGIPAFPLGPSKEVRTGMHRASLRVIIPVPEVGTANKSEGGAIVGVWIYTSGWSIDLEAPEMRVAGGDRFVRSVLVGCSRREAAVVPEAPGLESPLFAPADLVFERSELPFGDAARELLRVGPWT